MSASERAPAASSGYRRCYVSKEYFMKSISPVFDINWRESAALIKNEKAWFRELFPTTSTENEIGLLTLRLWTESLPLTEDQFKGFKRRLESRDNAEHWGAVAELAWWRLLISQKITARLIDTVKSPGNSRPDFEIISPTSFHAEVTTLNPSQKDEEAFSMGCGVEHENEETIRRLIGKITDEKLKQLQYSCSCGMPAVLVIFDSARSTGVGSHFAPSLEKWLYEASVNKENVLPNELSAIVYLIKTMYEGRMAVLDSRSAVFHNPEAKNKLPKESISFLHQHYGSINSAAPASKVQPIYL